MRNDLISAWDQSPELEKQFQIAGQAGFYLLRPPHELWDLPRWLPRGNPSFHDIADACAALAEVWTNSDRHIRYH